MQGSFFPERCEGVNVDKKGELVYCTNPWTDVLEPELQVYCHIHYKLIMEKREKNEHV